MSLFPSHMIWFGDVSRRRTPKNEELYAHELLGGCIVILQCPLVHAGGIFYTLGQFLSGRWMLSTPRQHKCVPHRSRCTRHGNKVLGTSVHCDHVTCKICTPTMLYPGPACNSLSLNPGFGEFVVGDSSHICPRNFRIFPKICVTVTQAVWTVRHCGCNVHPLSLTRTNSLFWGTKLIILISIQKSHIYNIKMNVIIEQWTALKTFLTSVRSVD